MKKLNFHFSLIILLFVSCQSNKSKEETDTLTSNIDSTLNPSKNFFMYANGRWFKENPIPQSESSNGIWRIIQDTVNAQIRQVCVRSSASVNEAGSNKQKIGW